MVPTVICDLHSDWKLARDVLSGGPLSDRGYAPETSGHCSTVVATVICDSYSDWKRARDVLSGGPLSDRGYAPETSGHGGTVVPTVICDLHSDWKRARVVLSGGPLSDRGRARRNRWLVVSLAQGSSRIFMARAMVDRCSLDRWEYAAARTVDKDKPTAGEFSNDTGRYCGVTVRWSVPEDPICCMLCAKMAELCEC